MVMLQMVLQCRRQIRDASCPHNYEKKEELTKIVQMLEEYIIKRRRCLENTGKTLTKKRSELKALNGSE